MKTFFGILKTMVFQILNDIFESFSDFLAVQWENRYKIIKSIILVICGIIIIFLDLLVVITLCIWAQPPLAVAIIVICSAMIITLQICLWIYREKFYKWFLNRWSRASQTYRHRRAEAQIVNMHNDHTSAVGKALDACHDSVDLNKTINNRISL